MQSVKQTEPLRKQSSFFLTCNVNLRSLNHLFTQQKVSEPSYVLGTVQVL